MQNLLARSGSLLGTGAVDDDDRLEYPSTKLLIKLAAANMLRRMWGMIPPRWTPLAYRAGVTIAGTLGEKVGAKGTRFLQHLLAQSRSLEQDYPSWIQLYERTGEDGRQAALAHIATFTDRPLFSVIMPVFNPPPGHLRAAIESVRNQFYPNWELCIADDASTDPAVTALLRRMQASDPRIKVTFRKNNGHIAAASNSALGLASGQFVALLDHDDILPQHALYQIAVYVKTYPAADILYSDEDHIDDSGHRSLPYFKPDWNPELLAGQNYFNHLTVYRRSLIESLGGFRLGLEGSQDYDLALRAVAATTAERIVHVPHVLYHWRQRGRSRSFSESSLDRCVTNGRRAVQDFLASSVPGARVEAAPQTPSWNRVIYPVPSPEPLVSVIIPTRNHADMLSRSVDGLLRRTDYPALEVLIADNGSDEPEALALLDDLSRDSRVRVLRCPGPFNYSALNNRMVSEAHGSLILMLNNDIDVISPGWMREMVSHAIRPGVGAVGAKLLYPDGTIQHGGVLVGMGGVAGHQYLHKPASDPGYFGQLQLVRAVNAVTGACLMVRRDLYLQAGGLDEVSLKVAFNDIDLCLKLVELGYRNVWTPYAELYHLESASRGSDRSPAKAARFEREVRHMMQRWGQTLDRDPYWNPNLFLHSHDVNLAFPPRLPQSLDQAA